MTDQPLGGGEQAGSLSANFASLSQVGTPSKREAVFFWSGQRNQYSLCSSTQGGLHLRRLAVTLASDVSCAS